MQDPQTSRTLYAGAAQGGIWKSEDGGDTWRSLATLLREGKEVAAPIGSIGLCHREPQHIYVGTGEPIQGWPGGHGLFYSSNGGTSFSRIAPPSSGAAADPIRADRFERIFVDPWQPKRAWIAAPTGLWRSGPGASAAAAPVFGAAADAIDAAPVAGNPQDITDIAIDFGDRTQAAPPPAFTVFAAVRGQGVFRATFDTVTGTYRLNAGVAWTRLGAAAAGPAFAALPTVAAAQLNGVRGRIKLALCERNAQHVYFIMAQGRRRRRPMACRRGSSIPPMAAIAGRSAPNGANSPDSGSAIGWYALTLKCIRSILRSWLPDRFI